MGFYRLFDAIIEASDGSVYDLDESTKFKYDRSFLDLLEAKPLGKLVKYDPIKKKTIVLIIGLGFANKVSLSTKEEHPHM